MKTISERCYNLSQSWHYKHVVAIGKLTFKVYIKRNAYDFQCEASVSVYDINSQKWNRIVSAPIAECECKKISYVQKNVQSSAFANDAKRLLNEAIEITR